MKLIIPIVLLFLFQTFVSAVNNKPIIGILTQPTDLPYGKTYIAASYIKFIESSGARVVPIFCTSPADKLKTLFGKINGILFPGGGASLSSGPYFEAGKYLYQLALEANDKGDFFPLQGHCLGFELLNVLASQSKSVLQPLAAQNVSLALNFYSDFRTSRLFKNAPQSVIDTLSTEKVTLNHHSWGVSPSSYDNTILGDFYQIISWNEDSKGEKFVSTLEGKKYPIYGIQWHAEKPLFEWNNWEDINHSEDSIEAMKYISDFFVSEARKSEHSFISDSDEYSSLIYNYEPMYSGHVSDSFVQMYFFNETL